MARQGVRLNPAAVWQPGRQLSSGRFQRLLIVVILVSAHAMRPSSLIIAASQPAA